MDKSDLLENLANLYLRINGYFTSGFIAHAPRGNATEIDVLAVRFPKHSEPEIDAPGCPRLDPPNDRIDIIVGEVKGGRRRTSFNRPLRENPDSLAKVLRRIGAFSEEELPRLIPRVMQLLHPNALRGTTSFPSLEVPSFNARLRFVLFYPEQVRSAGIRHPAIYGNDLVDFVWGRLHPAIAPGECSVTYRKELWGHQFNDIVAYFKDWAREAPGSVSDVLSFVQTRRRTEPFIASKP